MDANPTKATIELENNGLVWESSVHARRCACPGKAWQAIQTALMHEIYCEWVQPNIQMQFATLSAQGYGSNT